MHECPVYGGNALSAPVRQAADNLFSYIFPKDLDTGIVSLKLRETNGAYKPDVGFNQVYLEVLEGWK